MRLTSWNYLHGQLLDPAGQAVSPLEAALSDIAPDLICLQEIDFNIPRTGEVNQSGEIASLLGAKWWAFAPTVIGTPGERWRILDKGEPSIITAENIESGAGSYGISIVSTVAVKEWLRHDLGKSLIGMPLAIAGEGGKLRPIYVRDEPRVALAAVLDNGWTVINTHLSFVPLFNIFQLWKLSRWANAIEKKYATQVILTGDFNLPWGLPAKVTRWARATDSLTYPSWDPKVSFDYILLRDENIARAREVQVNELPISDHRPLTIEI